MANIEDNKCPVCGCDKPKIFINGRYQCADCKCVTDDGCQAEQGSSE